MDISQSQRSLAQPAPSADLFAEKAPLKLAIEGPLQPAFDAAHAGEPDPIIVGMWTRAKDSFKATVQEGSGPALDVKLKVRGNLSLTECPFPKVSVKFDVHSSAFSTSVFANTEQLKVGTHCDDSPARVGQLSTQGRLFGEIAAHREVIAWNLYGVIDPKFSLQARTARITWTDTSSTPPRVTEKDAFVFEHPNGAAQRLGLPEYRRTVEGKELRSPVLETSEIEALTAKEFDPERVRRILMFHAMIGNWDFAIDPAMARDHGGSVWNTDVLVSKKADGSTELIPVPTDFDRASLVSGRLPAQGARARQTPEAKQVSDYLKKFLKGHSRADVVKTKKYMQSQRQAFQRVIDNTPVDAEGRQLAQRHLDEFFKAVERLFPG